MSIRINMNEELQEWMEKKIEAVINDKLSKKIQTTLNKAVSTFLTKKITKTPEVLVTEVIKTMIPPNIVDGKDLFKKDFIAKTIEETIIEMIQNELPKIKISIEHDFEEVFK